MAGTEDTILQTYEPLAEELAVTAGLLQHSTVQVRTRGMGGGSGVIWRPDGLIITNAHVARGESATVELADSRIFEAEVVARDPERDLAALLVDATDLPAATVLDSQQIRVGQLVVAVGNPLGLTGALTMGIIHAIAPTEGRGRQDWLQADVRLDPGNSGGPLADVEGRVIGINSAVAGGLGLAVPSNAVGRFLFRTEDRPKLGVRLQPVQVPSGAERLPGLMVTEVEIGSAADIAGLLLGDILIAIAGRPFRSPEDLPEALAGAAGGRPLALDIIRAGARLQCTVYLLSESSQSQGAAA